MAFAFGCSSRAACGRAKEGTVHRSGTVAANKRNAPNAEVLTLFFINCYDIVILHMEITTQKFARFLFCFTLIAFLSVVFFGMSKTMMGMEKRNDGTMRGCLFSGKAEICTMTFSEHLSYLQNRFTITITAPQKALILALLVLLAVGFVAVAILKRNLSLLFIYYATRWRLYIKQNPHLSLFNPLIEAFSQGILNSKIYESATL